MKTSIKIVLSLATVLAIATTIVVADNVSVTAVSPITVIAQASSAPDKQLITKAVLEDDRRNNSNGETLAPLQVKKIAIANSYALAVTTIGEYGGGMAVLSKKQGNWQVIGGGGGWLVLKDLEVLGIPRNSAQVLLNRIDPKWKDYEPQ